MKIRIVRTWDEKDLGNGRWITRQSCPEDSENLSFMASVTYKLGFFLNGSNRYCKISVCDGMILSYNSKKELLESINNDAEGYRPTTLSEYTRMSKHLTPQCTEPNR